VIKNNKGELKIADGLRKQEVSRNIFQTCRNKDVWLTDN
jgi:hypothetical protein